MCPQHNCLLDIYICESACGKECGVCSPAFLDKSGEALQLGLDRTYARFNLVVLLLNAGEHHERP